MSDTLPTSSDAASAADIRSLVELVRELRQELSASHARRETLIVELERARASAARALRREEEAEQRLALGETSAIVRPTAQSGQQMQELLARLEAMQSSTSWRVTVPLRRVGILVKRFRRTV